MASWADTIATLEAEREHAETRRDRAEAVLEGGCRRQFGEPKIHGVDHYVSEFDYADGKRWGLEIALQHLRNIAADGLEADASRIGQAILDKMGGAR